MTDTELKALGVVRNADLKPLTTFAVPAKAKFYVEVKSLDALRRVLSHPELSREPRLVLGGGSNILFTKDFDGLVIGMRIDFLEEIGQTEHSRTIRVGAGRSWSQTVDETLERAAGGGGFTASSGSGKINGARYYIADIGLRMLKAHELMLAQGFPPDYVIDRDYTGKEDGKAKQVARCGNAVCPPMATALVKANFPEWCGQEITTMAQLEKVVAV